MDYSQEKSIYELVLTVMYLRKIFSTFYKNHLEKPIAILLLIDSALFIAKPIAKLAAKFFQVTKKKGGKTSRSSSKRTREV